jgi:hypothetical protein
MNGATATGFETTACRKMMDPVRMSASSRSITNRHAIQINAPIPRKSSGKTFSENRRNSSNRGETQ